VDEPVFDSAGLGMKPHLVVAIGLVARDGVQTFLDQFLDELIRRYQTPPEYRQAK
jgi:hypothetical protein